MRVTRSGPVGWSVRDQRRIEVLAGTLRMYGFQAAAMNAAQICSELGARETDRLIAEFGARYQLAEILRSPVKKPVMGGRQKRKPGSERLT